MDPLSIHVFSFPVCSQHVCSFQGHKRASRVNSYLAGGSLFLRQAPKPKPSLAVPPGLPHQCGVPGRRPPVRSWLRGLFPFYFSGLWGDYNEMGPWEWSLHSQPSCDLRASQAVVLLFNTQLSCPLPPSSHGSLPEHFFEPNFVYSRSPFEPLINVSTFPLHRREGWQCYILGICKNHLLNFSPQHLWRSI